jgi:hypothetical protein
VKVADLQQHLVDLAKLLDASGAKGVATDLNAIQTGLTPFRDVPLRTFADFLVRAEAYSRDPVPIVPPKTRQPRASTSRKAKADPAEVVERLRQLYERSGDPSVSTEELDQGLRLLGDLTKDGLLQVADALEIKGLSKKKVPEIREAVRQKVFNRRGASQRASMVDQQPMPHG